MPPLSRRFFRHSTSSAGAAYELKAATAEPSGPSRSDAWGTRLVRETGRLLRWLPAEPREAVAVV